MSYDDTIAPPSFQDFIRDNGGDPRYIDEAAARFVMESHAEAMQRAIEPAERERRDMTASEARTFEFHRNALRMFSAAFDAGKFGAISRKIGESRRQLGLEDSSATHRRNATGWSVGNEERTYAKGDQRSSWVKDMVAVNIRGDYNGEASQRLQRNRQEVETRALTTTDGAGGDFVPPAWLVDQFIALARSRRVTADLVQNMALPTGTDSINVPKLVSGTAVAEQASQNTGVQQTDAVTSAVQATVATLAGGQTVAVQLIEQSPINMDEILLQDLVKDLASKTNLFVLNNVTAGRLGLLQVAGTNTVTFTSASPTVAALYPKIADAASRVTTSVYDSPDAIVMHPRRWYWLLAAVDSGSRPLIVPSGQGPYNAVGQQNPGAPGFGQVGEIGGIPVFTDPGISTAFGAGTNEDKIIVLKRDVHVLYEGALNAEAFRAPKADQLSVFLRVYRYVAQATRYPAGVSIVTGTGLATPSF
ncbi:phage major capsid protein [Pedococcus ginsenosidimutans]